MLVLTRKPSQSIRIDVPGREPIVVLVVRTNSDRVRLGVTADRDVIIHRGEGAPPPATSPSPTLVDAAASHATAVPPAGETTWSN